MTVRSNPSFGGTERGGQYSSRQASPGPTLLDATPSDTQELIHSPSGTAPGQPAGVLRKKLYDQNLSDWSARYRKNKQSLDNLAKDCEMLRGDVARQQQEVDERAEGFRQLEDRYTNEVLTKFTDTKANYEAVSQQKGMFQVQLSENRKHKASLTREKMLLRADYERKHAELLRMAEARDQLEAQLSQVTHHLGQMGSDRKKMERELDMVQHNLRANTELADEVHHEIEHVFHGIKDSMDLHLAPSSRLDGSVGSPNAENSQTPSPRRGQ